MKNTEKMLSVRGSFQADMAKWVLDPRDNANITQELDQKISQVLLDRRRRIEVFLTALVRNHAERIMYLVSRMPKVEEELLDNPERIQAAKTSDLIRLLSTMSQSVEASSEFLRAFVSDADLRSEPMPFSGRFGGVLDEEDQDNEEDEGESDSLVAERKIALNLTVESRQRIGGVLGRIMNAIGYSANNDDDKQHKEVEAESVVEEKPKRGRKKKSKRGGQK